MKSKKASSNKVANALAGDGMEDYQARSDFEALARAHGIRKDKKRYKAAIAHGKAKAKGHSEVLQAEGEANQNDMV